MSAASITTHSLPWWSKQPGHKPFEIGTAINARLIMNNVLSGTPFEDAHIPYLIWWPTVAHESTYRQLVKVQPQMLPQIIRACIYAGYKDLFDELLSKVEPDLLLLREAEDQSDIYFRQALDRRTQSSGITPQHPADGDGWKLNVSGFFNGSFVNVQKFLDSSAVGTSFDGQYDGLRCNASVVEMNACLPDAWKLSIDDEKTVRRIAYEEWPPLDRSADART